MDSIVHHKSKVTNVKYIILWLGHAPAYDTAKAHEQILHHIIAHYYHEESKAGAEWRKREQL